MGIEDEDRFDWSSVNGDVILPKQRSLAVYRNPWGQAVIRAKADYPDEREDPFIVIDHANIPLIIKALRDIADEPLSREVPSPEPANDQ
jgi:hypothetical protein